MSQSNSKARDVQANDDGRQKVPRWSPIILLTVATAALTFPAVLLWRQRQALGHQTRFSLRRAPSASALPPVRRRPRAVLAAFGSGSEPTTKPFTSSADSYRAVPPRRSPSKSNVLSSSSPLANAKPKPSTGEKAQEAKLSEILSDGPFLSLGAFGIATAAVGVGAVFGVWGVQKALGVKNVEEFAVRVRELFLTHMPAISQRIYRPSSSEEGSSQDNAKTNGVENWRWDEAEDRLRDAFDRGGVEEWAECAIRELEAEEELERRRRGL